LAANAKGATSAASSTASAEEMNKEREVSSLLGRECYPEIRT
jgi:hypothetical protein